MVPPEGRKFCASFYDPGRAVKPPLVPFARAGYQLSTVTDVGARRKRQLLGPGRDPGGDRLGIASPGEDHDDRPSETSGYRWRYRQVKLEGDGEAPKLARAANLCGSLGASDLGPDRERLRAD